MHMIPCFQNSSDFPPDRAADVFVHALENKYPELIDKSALILCRYPTLDLVEASILPSDYIVPWVSYLSDISPRSRH